MTKDEFLKDVVVDEDVFAGTGCWPNLRASYLELVDLFGEPNVEGDGMESDCGWSFKYKGTGYTLCNKDDGVAAQGFEGIPTDYLDEWHVWSDEQDPDLRKTKADELKAALTELCPMEKYPTLTFGEITKARKNMMKLSQRGLVQVLALIDAWDGDIFPDKRTDAEILAESEKDDD